VISKANYNCRRNRRILHRHILPAPAAGYSCEVYLTLTAAIRYRNLIFAKGLFRRTILASVRARRPQSYAARIVSRLMARYDFNYQVPPPSFANDVRVRPPSLPASAKFIAHVNVFCRCARKWHEIQRIPSVRLAWASFRAFAHFLNKVRRRLQNLSTASQQAASIAFCA
jgi:hypothetical protein